METSEQAYRNFQHHVDRLCFLIVASDFLERETDTGFVESTANQVVSERFVKKQQMRWTPRGAHLLLQTRTKVLNGDLEKTFRGWYPTFRCEAEALPA